MKPRLVRLKNGHFYWVWPNGEFVPLIAGGAPVEDDDEEDPGESSGARVVTEQSSADDDDDDDDDVDDDGSERKFTQSDVNRLLNKEKRKTRRTVEREVAERLGMSIPDAATALEKIARGEPPEARARLEQRERQLDEREVQLDRRSVEMSVREKLQELGCRPERLKRAVRLVDLEDDPDGDDIASAVEELKDDMPELFVAKQEREERTPPPSSDVKPRRRTKPPTEDKFNEGAQLASRYTGAQQF